jgi:hypothetical protein
MDRINRLVIDSSGAVSDLCVLGAEYPTDKSPYNFLEGQDVARHCYTAVYDLLFAARRFEPIVLGEIGIASNMSMHMWRAYFPNALLFGFDYAQHWIDRAVSHGLARTYYGIADMNSPLSLFNALSETRQTFDILIDDSTHAFQHQISFIEVATHFIKPGGMLIVEDVFKGWDEARYHEALLPYHQYFLTATFMEMVHVNRHSPGTEEPHYNNDKLLVLVRNQQPPPRRHAPLVQNPRLVAEALARPLPAPVL